MGFIVDVERPGHKINVSQHSGVFLSLAWHFFCSIYNGILDLCSTNSIINYFLSNMY